LIFFLYLNTVFANSGGGTTLRSLPVYSVQMKKHEHALAAAILLIICYFSFFFIFAHMIMFTNFSLRFKLIIAI
jgi:hypothetical protein